MGSTLLPTIVLSFLGGFVAAFLSLTVSSVWDVPSLETASYGWLFVLVMVEEVSKLTLLASLQSLSNIFKHKRYVIGSALLFGFGFGMLEFILIMMDSPMVTVLSITLVFAIHLATSLILALGIYWHLQYRLKWISLFALLLAIVFHLCYNLIVVVINARQH